MEEEKEMSFIRLANTTRQNNGSGTHKFVGKGGAGTTTVKKH